VTGLSAAQYPPPWPARWYVHLSRSAPARSTGIWTAHFESLYSCFTRRHAVDSQKTCIGVEDCSMTRAILPKVLAVWMRATLPHSSCGSAVRSQPTSRAGSSGSEVIRSSWLRGRAQDQRAVGCCGDGFYSPGACGPGTAEHIRRRDRCKRFGDLTSLEAMGIRINALFGWSGHYLTKAASAALLHSA
jgi:hypothetical protein